MIIECQVFSLTAVNTSRIVLTKSTVGLTQRKVLLLVTLPSDEKLNQILTFGECA